MLYFKSIVDEGILMRFRLMTYNIHKGIGGVDRRYRPERIIEVVEHCQPDILLLQEVDDGVPRSRLDRQVDTLGEALGYAHRAYQHNVSLRRGFYGNAILSRRLASACAAAAAGQEAENASRSGS